MKVMSFNTRVWTRDKFPWNPNWWIKRYLAIRKMIKRQSPDIICFQEVEFPSNIILVPNGYKRIGFKLTEHPIYVKRGMNVSKYIDEERWCTAEVDGVVVVNTHPWWYDGYLYNNIQAINSTRTESMANNIPTVICGDFNATLQDIESTAALYAKSVRKMLGINEDGYTYKSWEEPNKELTIDHFFVSSIVPKEYYMLDNHSLDSNLLMSDHYPIVIDFDK